MQLLIVLFLVVLLTIVGLALFFGLSYVIGSYLNSRTGSKADAADANPCAQSYADYAWYQALPAWQQTVAVAWWWVIRIQSSRKGC